MKYTFLFILLFSFISIKSHVNSLILSKSKEVVSLDLGNNNLSLHMCKIQIVDELTTETLVGVKNRNTYSDLDGILLVDKDKPISLEFISYEKLNTIVKNDTIIKMNSIK